MAERDASVVKPLGATAAPPPAPLAVGSRLHEYRIDAVLGQGRFGTTYLAADLQQNAPVVIKEFLPAAIAFRASDQGVSPSASPYRERYRRGLLRFLDEARTRASLRHPAILRVLRCFEAHHTAYLVLEYEKGQSFKAWWPAHRDSGEKALVDKFMPLFAGLAALHAAGVLHRDIKPGNIQVRAADGRFVLLDFAMPGEAVAAEGEAVVPTPGYAAIEQYGAGRQGAWTDVYALGATLYWAVAGRKPPDAETRRAEPRLHMRAVEVGRGRFSRPFLEAIDRALALEPAQRPQDLVEFGRALFADQGSKRPRGPAPETDSPPTEPGGFVGGDTVIEGDAPPPRTRPLPRWRRLPMPSAWPLALKMGAAVLVMIWLPLGLGAAWMRQATLAELEQGQMRLVEQAAQGSAARIAQFVDDGRHIARTLAGDSDVVIGLAQPDPGLREMLRDKIGRVLHADPLVQGVTLIDRSGAAVVSSETGQQLRQAALGGVLAPSSARSAALTAFVAADAPGPSDLMLVEAVTADDGRVLGALLLRLSGSALAATLAQPGDPDLMPFLVDGDGIVALHPRQELMSRSLVALAPERLAAVRAQHRYRELSGDSLDEPDLAAAMRGARGPGHVGAAPLFGQGPAIAGFAPVPGQDWVVGVSEPSARFAAPLDAATREMLFGIALVGLVAAVLAWRFGVMSDALRERRGERERQ